MPARPSAPQPPSRARLGDVHVMLGQNGEARKQYERVLEMLKNGDPDLPLLVKTKEALAKLGS